MSDIGMSDIRAADAGLAYPTRAVPKPPTTIGGSVAGLIPGSVGSEKRTATSVVEAAGNHDMKQVEDLIRAGADVNEKDPLTGGTAMHRASKHGELDVVSMLETAGADINAVDNKYGATPLHCAAAAGNRAMVLQLTSLGADFMIRNKSGKTAGERAHDCRHYQLANILFHMEIEASFSTGVIPTRDRHPRDHCKCIPDNGAKAVVCIEKSFPPERRRCMFPA